MDRADWLRKLRRSTPHFFHDRDTYELVERVAALNSVLVYGGAGVSIDRVGLDWSGLADKLLVTHIDDKMQRDAFIELFGPLPAASVAHQYYGGDDKSAREAIIAALRVALYKGRRWSGGRLTRNMSRFLVSDNARKRDSNARRGAVTTNFDDFFEQDLQDEVDWVVANTGTHTEFERFFSADELKTQTPEQISCTYLHGYISDRSRPETRCGPDRAVVVSECDYYDSRSNRSFEDLTTAIGNTNLVIVGSSLTDPPLLRALTESRGNGYERYVILPLQQWQFDADTRKPLIDFIKMRLKHLDVTPIFPDFFSQCAQFFRESLTCIEHGPGSYASEDSKIRYGQRLNTWWHDWHRTASPDMAGMQSADHLSLATRLDEIRDMLKASKNEDLKLEAWLRWETPDHRELRLWAASVGTWRETQSMRKAEIEPDCPYASVQAFCQGRPMLLPAQGDDATRRWESYFAVPVWWQTEDGEVPVGVVSLASSQPLGQGSVSEKQRLVLDAVRTRVEKVGNQIVHPERIAPDDEGEGSD